MGKLEESAVVKIGGSIFRDKDTTIEDIALLVGKGKPLIIVHGGANVVTEWMRRLGLKIDFSNGERITDRQALEVVTAVLAGLVNKEITAAILAKGARAVGLSGVDGGLIQGKVRSPEAGYLGDVVRVEPGVLSLLLEANMIPVVSPVSLLKFSEEKSDPLLLNINGDAVAGEIAYAIGARKLIFLTDVEGISDKHGSLMKELSPGELMELIDSGVAFGGMIPKLKACLRAASKGTTCIITNGKRPHALLDWVEGEGSGTVIKGEAVGRLEEH